MRKKGWNIIIFWREKKGRLQAINGAFSPYFLVAPERVLPENEEKCRVYTADNFIFPRRQTRR